MTIEEALYTHLTSHTGLSALVGTRVYPTLLPQDPTLPALTYFRAGTGWTYTGGGPGATESSFQVSCWATTYGGAKQIAIQVRDAIGAHTGIMGGAGGVYIAGTWLENEIDVYEPETGVYHVAVEVRINHE